MKLGLLGYTSGSIFNRTAKTGVSRLEQSTLGLTANRTSTSTRTRKSGVFRPEDNGTKQYYKGDLQSFFSSATNNLSYSSFQPSGLEVRPNDRVIYGISGRSDTFGSTGYDVNQITLGTVGNLNSVSLAQRSLLWRQTTTSSNFYPNMQGMTFRSDGLRLFGAGTLRRNFSGTSTYYGSIFYLWTLGSAFNLTNLIYSTVPGQLLTGSGGTGVWPQYFVINANGNNPSSTPIDDSDISDGPTGAAGHRIKDTFMHPDGLIFYYLSNDIIYQGSLSSAWRLGFGTGLGTDVLSLNTSSLTVTPNDYSVNAFTFNSTGTKLFTFATTNNRIQQYNLGTAWQLSSATLSTSLDVTVSGGNKRIGIKMLRDQSTIVALSRNVTTSSSFSSNGFLHEINQALY
jgi:hypothetical protein